MKIKFIDEEGNNIDIKNIYLSANNPRYTLIDNFNIDLSKFITNNNYKNEESNFLNLLKSEGNFKELSRLLDSINKSGFNNKSEPIYLVEHESNYIVAEGNRRLMCLKLINGDFKFPEIYNFDYQDYQDSLTEYEQVDGDIDEKKEQFYNFKKCQELLEEIKAKDSELQIFYKITNDEEELWSLIYDRHLSGNRPGMREWSRSKYFADLLSIFKEGLKNEKETEIIKKFRREWGKIKTDFCEAQYIYSCFFFNEIDSDIETPNFINPDKDILEKMIHSNRISALERTHSFNKIRKLICENIVNCSIDEFKETYLNIKFEEDNNYRIKFETKKNFPYQKLLSWILKRWEDKKITTREFKDQLEDELINELKYNVISGMDFDDHLSLEELNELNEFDLSTDQLDKIILANSNYYDEQKIHRFKVAKDIKDLNSEFIGKIKGRLEFNDVEPLKVFNILERQLKHNSENRNFYINAICATLRSLLEQILRLLIFIYICRKNNDDEKSNFIKSVASGKCFFSSKYSSGKKIFIINKKEITDLSLKIGLDNCLIDNNKSDEFRKKIMTLINKFGDSKNTNGLKLLNENIHALHRIYLSKEYNDRLDEIRNIEETILDLMWNINFTNEYFKELNDKVIDYIRTNEL